MPGTSPFLTKNENELLQMIEQMLAADAKKQALPVEAALNLVQRMRSHCPLSCPINFIRDPEAPQSAEPPHQPEYPYPPAPPR